MDPEMKLHASIIAVESIVFCVSFVVFGVWLLRLYKKHGDPAYGWLCIGIAIIPLINFVTSFLLFGYVANWFFEQGMDYMDYFFRLNSILQSLLQIACSICIFIALSKFAKGAVPFSALFFPFRRRDDYDTY